MRHPVDGNLRGFARTMRKESTNAERRMWARLRNGQLNGLKFRRQVPIGNAIADFVCYEHQLIVEVDGGQHSENAYDKLRDAELTRRGFRVLRFWNIDVMRNTRGVLDTILAATRDDESERHR
jgi:very-short-patch-repair endonuclease